MTNQGSERSVLIRSKAVPYRIRHSRRARRSAIKIDPRTGLEVVLPQGTPDDVAEEILRDNSGWLDRHADIAHRAHRTILMKNGSQVPLRGTWINLEIILSESPRISCDQSTLRIFTQNPNDEKSIRAQLEKWFRIFARSVITQRVNALHHQNDGLINRIVIRDQTTCWASCSDRGTLSFNWRLVMTPPDVLDAIITHELIHLKINDHSKMFWNRLINRFPRYYTCRRWLDSNSYRLGI